MLSLNVERIITDCVIKQISLLKHTRRFEQQFKLGNAVHKWFAVGGKSERLPSFSQKATSAGHFCNITVPPTTSVIWTH